MAAPDEPAGAANHTEGTADRTEPPRDDPRAVPPTDHTDSEDHPAGTRASNSGIAAGHLPSTGVPWPRLARPDDPGARRVEEIEHPQPASPAQWPMWLAAQVCGFGLLLGGYLLGQAWAPASKPETVSDAPRHARSDLNRSTIGTERALESIARALAAETNGDRDGAAAIYEELIRRRSPLPGAEYRLALLALQRRDNASADTHLARSIAAGENVSNSELLRARLAGMNNDYAEAATRLAIAQRAEPFDARVSFCLGEALRRAGRLPEAIRVLTSTLDRPAPSMARRWYQFKLRLAKVEAGADETLDAEISTHVGQEAPGGEWLMLSAAEELGRRNYAAASQRLAQAKRYLAPEEFRNDASDYVFQRQAAREELKSVIDLPSGVGSLRGQEPAISDPTLWTEAEADPAGWPPFAPAP